MPETKVVHRLDLRGKVCPFPTYDTLKAVEKLSTGDILEVVTDYYPVRQTIPALMLERGYRYELEEVDGTLFRFRIFIS